MREKITDLLDGLGVLLFAAGIGFAASHLIGWAALAVSGVVVVGGSHVVEHGMPAWRRKP